ncbi:MAG: class I SAM-dependent methyltransferase [Thermoleophilia bacterium]|nr:class I SAM-dependent methyltransferase [Thermoleophilia bacterium]
MNERESDEPHGGEAYEQLGELYDAWCAEVVEDVSFYVGLADALAAELGRVSIDVVELGAGSGRMTEPLAQAGHRVTAIEISPSQLERLHGRIERESLQPLVTTLEGDMRTVAQLVAPASADLVVVPFRGMLHVTPERDAVLAAIAQVLRPRGVVAFDVFHPSAEQIELTHGRWLHRREELTRGGRWRFQERARYLPEFAAEAGGLKLEVDVRCRWKRSRQRRALEFLPYADPPEHDRERHATLELQLVPAERWAASLAAAGFQLDGAYGWFDARPLSATDDDSIWVARLDPLPATAVAGPCQPS